MKNGQAVAMLLEEFHNTIGKAYYQLSTSLLMQNGYMFEAHHLKILFHC